MEETDKENDLKVMKYANGSAGSAQCCKSQELVLVSELQEAASTSRSNDYKIKNEGKVIFRKKSLLPIFAPNHPYRAACYTVSSNCKSNVSLFTQRIMSAKLLGVRNLQNKLSETQIRLQELVEENRVLNALLKRQERALKKYEGEEAQLPQLIKTHSDEMRVLQTKYKQLKTTCHDLEQKLKTRDNELNCLREQHRHLLHLSKDKHLGEREKLRQQVDELLETVNAQEDKIKTLMRKAELESKSHKHQLRVEIGKHRETQRQLSLALSSIQKLEAALEVKQKYSTGISNRPHHFSTNAVMGPLPAIAKQVLSGSQISPLKERLNEVPAHEHLCPEKNGSGSNPTTVTSSAPNSEYEGSEISGSHSKNRKTSNSSSDSRKSKTKSDSSKSKMKSQNSYDYNFESSDSAKVPSDIEGSKNNSVLPDIFVNENSESKNLRTEKVSSDSSRKSLTRQDSVRDETDLNIDSLPKTTLKSSFDKKEFENSRKEDFLYEHSNGRSYGRSKPTKTDLKLQPPSHKHSVDKEEFENSEKLLYNQEKPDVNKRLLRSYSFDNRELSHHYSSSGEDREPPSRKNSANQEQPSWEEIKKQVRAEHEAAKKKLESFSNFESDLLDFSLGNELDSSKKNALLKALNEIDREKCEVEHSDSDSSYKGKFGSDFMEFYRPESGESRALSDELSAEQIMKKRNGLVRDWFFNQYDYGIAAGEREKLRAVNASDRKGSDSS